MRIPTTNTVSMTATPNSTVPISRLSALNMCITSGCGGPCCNRSGNGPQLLELDDAVPVVPQLEQDLLGVLGELGRHRAGRPGRAPEVDRRRDHVHRVAVRRDRDEAAGGANLG